MALKELQIDWIGDRSLRETTSPKLYPCYWGEYILLHPLYEGKRTTSIIGIFQSQEEEKSILVIKQVKESYTDLEEFEANFKNIGQHLFFLNHRNIPKLYDVGEYSGIYYHAREYIHGKDLLQLLLKVRESKKTIPLDLVLFITVEILKALYQAWRQSRSDGLPLRMIHGELYPSKVMLTYNGEVKVIGFGWAWIKPKGSVTWPLGTILPGVWDTPETITGQTLKASSDVFSVGLLLYTMLSLELPGLENKKEYIEKLKSGDGFPLISFEGLPNIVKPILERCLILDPEKRFQDCGEVLRTLNRLLYKLNPRIGHYQLSSYLESFFEVEKKVEEEKLKKILPEGIKIPEKILKGKTRTLLDSEELRELVETERKSKLDEKEPLYQGLLPGTKYRIVRLLGEGSMGSVYAVEHIALGKIFALKLLHAYRKSKTEFVERFRQEAKASARLKHPNIVSITDYGETQDGIPYFVMEYLEGETLAEYLDRKGRVELGLALDIIMQVLSALEVAHKEGIVHRDIKPENIFLSYEELGKKLNVKLLDFGIAAVTKTGGGGVSPGYIAGTPLYMSPEQARGETLDGRSDLYSVGVVLYRMITGRPPFTAKSAVELLHKHCNEPPPKIKEVAPELLLPQPIEDFIMKALEKLPHKRFSDASEMKRALEEAITVSGAILRDSSPMLDEGMIQILASKEIEEIWSKAVEKVSYGGSVTISRWWSIRYGVLIGILVSFIVLFFFISVIPKRGVYYTRGNDKKLIVEEEKSRALSLSSSSFISENEGDINVKDRLEVDQEEEEDKEVKLVSDDVESVKITITSSESKRDEVAKKKDMIKEAKFLIQKGAISKAEELIEKLKKNYSDSHELYSVISELYFEKGDYKKAYEYAQKAYQKRPNKIEYIINMGVTLYRLGMWEEAKQYWEKALKLDPQNNVVKYYLKIIEVSNKRRKVK